MILNFFKKSILNQEIEKNKFQKKLMTTLVRSHLIRNTEYTKTMKDSS